MNKSAPADLNSYDDVPYDSLPFPQTHPDRLATLARLFGLEHPPLDGCRILELGCAAGGNLIPLAEQLPNAELVGIDLSGRQIAEGQRVVEALRLQNVRLVAGSIGAIDRDWGEFDFILCHGVYSWVGEDVQKAILAVCSERLTRNGIAYVSYNTLPGWRMRGMIRDLMRYHALHFSTPVEQIGQARAILDFLAKAVPADETAYSDLLRSELELLDKLPDHYLYHEHLEAVNEPVYFRTFVERAATHGLKYLAEADFATMLSSGFAPDVAQTVQRIAPDLIGQEQLLDFIRNRRFRQTLLIHADREVDRQIPRARIEGFRLASLLTPQAADPDLRPGIAESFRLPDGKIIHTQSAPTKAAFAALYRCRPGNLSWPELLVQVEALLHSSAVIDPTALAVLQADLMQAFTLGMVNLHVLPSPFTAVVGERPQSGRLARFQANAGAERVTALDHTVRRLDERTRALVGWMDGHWTRDQLRQRFCVAFPESAADGIFDALLAELARAALLRSGDGDDRS